SSLAILFTVYQLVQLSKYLTSKNWCCLPREINWVFFFKWRNCRDKRRWRTLSWSVTYSSNTARVPRKCSHQCTAGSEKLTS
ncbi:hypothetical protein MKW98_001562, partial [Papaver atlanticum]